MGTAGLSLAPIFFDDGRVETAKEAFERKRGANLKWEVIDRVDAELRSIQCRGTNRIAVAD